MEIPNHAASDLFPVYTDIPSRISLNLWSLIQTAGVITAFVLVYLLFFQPETGLFILWKIAVPLLPFVFVIMPGIWRNSCPLAVINQIPRRFGFAKSLNPPKFIRNYGFIIAFSILLLLVTSRKIIFNSYGEATAVLILAIVVIAFTGGLFFKGKSGFCSSICPVLPVERIYGQSPFLFFANVHCRQCLGCTKNCYDFNPSASYLADQYDEDRKYSSRRRFFASFFPGYVLSYFVIAEPPVNSIPVMLSKMFLITVLSSVIFYLLDAFIKTFVNRLPSIFGITAFTIYYWFTIPILAGSFLKLTGIQIPDEIILGLKLVTVGFSLYWLYRASNVEKIFISEILNTGVPVKTLFGSPVNVSINIPEK